MTTIEQGYPGGPRPEGAHRTVMCMNCNRPEARRTLIRRINDQLAEAMNDPDWKNTFRNWLVNHPEERRILEVAVGIRR